MGELLEGFVAQMESQEGKLDISALLNEEEIADWELLVKLYQEIEIGNIGKSLKTISKFYNTNRWHELSLLALVKMYELMWKTHKPQLEAIQSQLNAIDGVNPPTRDSSGGMFG
jgi:hypothetical protein|tara:strand:- start:44 stop:385 length:342 start_codon:yes stop_codon:yes gene_type:complete